MLLGAVASASAAQDVWNGSPPTVPSIPIWLPPAIPFLPFNNWSTGAPPTPAEDAIFPAEIPTFPFLNAAPAPLNQLANGKTIFLVSLPQNIAPPGFGSVQLSANSLTFRNNYRLIDVFTLIPAQYLSLLPFTSAPILLSNGNVTVDKGSVAEIDAGLQSVNGTVTKRGRGTLLLNGTVYGNLNARQGTLGVGSNLTIDIASILLGKLVLNQSPGTIRVTGNYTQNKDATLSIPIASTTSYGKLITDGSANLAGTLAVSYADGFEVKRGDKFNIIHANNGVNGHFSVLTDSQATGTLLTLGVVYKTRDVFLEIIQGSFAALPHLTPNQLAVGRALDRVVDESRSSNLIDHLDRLRLNDVPSALDRIAPEELTSIFTIGVSLAQVQSGNIQRRTDDIRSGSNGFSAAGLAINGISPSYSGSFGTTTGVAGPSGDDGKSSKEIKDVVTPAENRWGAFLSGTGEWVSVGNTDNARGYTLDSGGFTLGVDYKLTPNLAVGLAAGYTGTTADLTEGGRVHVNGGKIGLYATFFQNQQVAAAPTMSKDSSKDSKEVQAPVANVAKGFYADLAVFGGYNSYDFHRRAFEGTARGDTDGGELNVLFGAGYDFKRGNFTFGPTASFNYTYLGTSEFTEHGSLSPLDVHGGKGESLRTAFGIKASYDWKVGSVLVKPEIRAAWQHEYGDTAYDLTSSFANGAGGSFTVAGPQIGRDSALLGAGVSVQFSDRCGAFVYYDGELGRTNYHATAVTGGVRISF